LREGGALRIAVDRCLDFRDNLIREMEKDHEVVDPTSFVDLWIEALARIHEIARISDTVVFTSDRKPVCREEAMKLLAALDKAHQKLQDEPSGE